ncbi:DUF4181 domain-containing protein [Lysinibacillus sp. NPDC096418]|uniref:DUF4181 domain-containing protein n=1 Tax=Lysinibacillus sp. NPDC096418 TaxID=3364138 RepID=UPI0038200BD8
MQILLFIVVITILFFILEKVLDKLFGIEKKKISDTPAKNFNRWGRCILLVIFLCMLPFFYTNETNIKWYWIFYITSLLCFQAILEWKYLKDSKQYIKTIIFLILYEIMMFNIDYLFSFFN